MIFSPNKPLKINTSINTEKVRYDSTMPGRCGLFSCLAGCRETHTSDNTFLPKMERISITPHDPNVLFLKCGGEMIFLAPSLDLGHDL